MDESNQPGMVLLALPYTIVLSVVGFLAVYFWL
ncbi:MAG: hypothetical protein HQ553_06590 [Chloroflexi bacterium]|nr:hypothetical protein [Chloroflexota bacterium]